MLKKLRELLKPPVNLKAIPSKLLNDRISNAIAYFPYYKMKSDWKVSTEPGENILSISVLGSRARPSSIEIEKFMKEASSHISISSTGFLAGVFDGANVFATVLKKIGSTIARPQNQM